MTNSRAANQHLLIKETLVIATGVVAPTNGTHLFIDTEASASTDDLVTITINTKSQIIVLQSVAAARDPTVKDGTGNIYTATDFTFTSDQDKMLLITSDVGAASYELSRSDNA